jgi:hypothetical protein
MPGGRSSGGILVRPHDERNMSAHKYSVGQAVRFSPDRNQDVAARGGSFTVVRQLPEEASVLQYRVKSKMDGHERVVREDQLTRS